jgi:hypothetical protein
MLSRRRLVGTAASGAAWAAATAAAGQWRSEPAPPAAVKLDPASAALATISPGALGVAVNGFKAESGELEAFKLIGAAGATLVSFDSGMAVDLYDWRGNVLKKDPVTRPQPYEGRLDPAYPFEAFVQGAQAIGAQMMVYANYGTGTPEEAAAWVDHANNRMHYGVKYWEIGQCLWGNGYYPEISHEPDGRADKSPAAYGHAALKYVQAMKAADPTIKVGVGLAPAYSRRFPERLKDFAEWNRIVLEITGKAIDFADIFFYPGPRGPLPDADVLSAPADNFADISNIKAAIRAHQPANKSIELIMAEANSAAPANAQQIGQVGALFLADHFLTMYEAGLSKVLWYVMHGGLMGGGLYGHGDLGLLSSGECTWSQRNQIAAATTQCQAPKHTPFRALDGMQMLSKIVTPGSELLKVASSDPLVAAHAARQAPDAITLLFLNKDPIKARSLVLDLGGQKLDRKAEVAFYGPASRSIETWAADTAELGKRPLILQPFSLTFLRLKRA